MEDEIIGCNWCDKNIINEPTEWDGYNFCCKECRDNFRDMVGC